MTREVLGQGSIRDEVRVDKDKVGIDASIVGIGGGVKYKTGDFSFVLIFLPIGFCNAGVFCIFLVSLKWWKGIE